MATITSRLQQVQQRIARACVAAGRPAQSVTLLAVSKTCPAAGVREAFAAGQVRFGENYV
ncbi:MAG TPA: YggS family pyridoxal phosphate enzyme, partial [Burkholderiaceae bacterium]